jgi:hypothetical protein
MKRKMCKGARRFEVLHIELSGSTQRRLVVENVYSGTEPEGFHTIHQLHMVAVKCESEPIPVYWQSQSRMQVQRIPCHVVPPFPSKAPG